MDYLYLALGLVCAGIGGELFVKGTVGLGLAFRLSPGIIAATIAAFATSSPELTVAMTSALEGAPEISFGDVLGSNVVNVALILGLTVLIAPVGAPSGLMRRDFPAALLQPLLAGLLIIDGEVSRLDAALLLALFVVWLGAVVIEVRRQRDATADVLGEHSPRRAVIESAIGLVFLIAAGKLIVVGATGLARTFGLSDFVIGATIVAVGTSVPELATAIISRLRCHDEVGLGAVLGSNIFNGFFIVGVAAAITPIHVALASAVVPLVLCGAAVALTAPFGAKVIGRWRGGFMLAIYAVYLAVVLQQGH